MKSTSWACILFVMMLLCSSCQKNGSDDDDLADDDSSDDDVGDDDVGDDDAGDDDVGDDDSASCDQTLTFREVTRGESTGDGAGTIDDCDDVVFVVIDSQEELENQYASILPAYFTEHGTPSGIDFQTEIAVLSHNIYCSGLGLNLWIDYICNNGGEVVLHETILLPDGYLGETGVTYNLSTIPRDNYAKYSLVYDVEYEKP